MSQTHVAELRNQTHLKTLRLHHSAACVSSDVKNGVIVTSPGAGGPSSCLTSASSTGQSSATFVVVVVVVGSIDA